VSRLAMLVAGWSLFVLGVLLLLVPFVPGPLLFLGGLALLTNGEPRGARAPLRLVARDGGAVSGHECGRLCPTVRPFRNPLFRV
jgi:hypothetical protein